MTKPRKPTQKPASDDSELLALGAKFDDIERLRTACQSHGADDFQDMEDVETELGGSIMRCKATTLAGLRVKAKAAKDWYGYASKTPEEIAALDCEEQWIASFIESIESLTA